MIHPGADHQTRLRNEIVRMISEVPLYAGRALPGDDLAAWLLGQPLIGKRDLRRGFPKSLLRAGQDLNAAMDAGEVTLLATSGTTSDRLQVIWEWSWWDPQEREAMRLNAGVAAAMLRPGYREAVLTTPACGAGACHLGDQTMQERTIDGMLFLNQSPDPSYWSERECTRMIEEWNAFAPVGIEADPAYLAMLCRAARKQKRTLTTPACMTLTYETTTRAMREEIAQMFDAPAVQLYGATEAGVLYMECEKGLLHLNAQHAHVELLPVGEGLARVVVTTLGREWMPLLRYDIGDIVRVSELTECPCGRPAQGALLQRMEGRASDCVARGDGLTTPLMLDDAMMVRAPQMLQWQLAGDTLSVVGSGALEAAAAASELLGRTIRGESVAAIAPEASGKYRLVRNAS